jgi:phage terminase large subunit
MPSVGEITRLRDQVGELVERHEEKRSVREFRRYADDPVGFIRKELKGTTVWPRQVEIAESVRDCRNVVVRAGNGLGKDWIAARLALWWVYCRGGLCLVTGPTERQVKEIVMGEVRRAFAAARTLPGDLYEMALRLDRNEHAGIIAFTSGSSSMITGFHAPAVMAIITEAQGVENFVYEGIIANTTGEESRILAIGNPLTPSGRYYQINRSSNWRALRIDAHEHPNVVEAREIIPGAVTQDFIRTIAEEYGEGSGVYRSRVLGEFPEDDDESLVRRAWLERSAKRWGEARASVPLDFPEPYTFALDPARFGTDKTALAIRQGSHVHEIVTWGKTSTMGTVRKLLDEIDRREAGRGRIVVDEVGLGGGVVDRLREKGCTVDAFNSGSAPSPRGHRFFNRRAEVFWMIRKQLEDDALDLPVDELLWDELTAMRWRTNSQGKIQIEPKDELRKRLGRSPDRADALAMTAELPRAQAFFAAA